MIKILQRRKATDRHELAIDAWSESEHSRAANGQFGSGGGAAKGKSKAEHAAAEKKRKEEFEKTDYSYVKPSKSDMAKMENRFTENYRKESEKGGEGTTWQRAFSKTVEQLHEANPSAKYHHIERALRETVSDSAGVAVMTGGKLA